MSILVLPGKGNIFVQSPLPLRPVCLGFHDRQRVYDKPSLTFGGVPCSAILSHIMLNEKLNMFGVLGALLCILGSITIVLHAPDEQEITSLVEVWQLALQPGEALFDFC
jgi:hypothetical protein